MKMETNTKLHTTNFIFAHLLQEMQRLIPDKEANNNNCIRHLDTEQVNTSNNKTEPDDLSKSP